MKPDTDDHSTITYMDALIKCQTHSQVSDVGKMEW